MKQLLIILLFSFYVFGATQTAASASLADVTTAYNAAATGDTVAVSGSATWTSGLTVSKKITLLGSACTLTTSSAMAKGFFNIKSFTADTLCRVTGFVFNLTNHTPACAIYVEAMTGCYAGVKIRIDHNVIKYGYQGIVYYHVGGLIDNNTLQNCLKGIDAGAGSRDYADSSWNNLNMGDNRAVFIEDNTFLADANYPTTSTQEHIGTEQGAKLVIRYNTFNTSAIPDGTDGITLFMSHGNADGGCTSDPKDGYWQRDDSGARCIRRGQACVEFYENTASGKRIDYLVTLRGSANLIYNNEITNTQTNNPRIYMREEEYASDDATDWTTKRTAWPAEDQVHNTFIWNNTYRGADFNDGTYGYIQVNAEDESGIVEDRDYWLHAPAATGGKETFTDRNGAAGSNPTDGDPYANYGTMSFSSAGANAYYGYAAYTYPHPLGRNRKCVITIVR